MFNSESRKELVALRATLRQSLASPTITQKQVRNLMKLYLRTNTDVFQSVFDTCRMPGNRRICNAITRKLDAGAKVEPGIFDLEIVTEYPSCRRGVRILMALPDAA